MSEQDVKDPLVHDDEYMLEPVPENKRRSTLSQIAVWIGFGYVVTGLMVGGQLAGMHGHPGMPFGMAMITIYLGMGILFLMTSGLGIAAQKTGLNLALLSRYSYGSKGFIIPAGVMSILTLAWFGQLTGMVSDYWSYLIGNPTGVILFDPVNMGFTDVAPITLEFFLVSIAWGAIFTICAVKGMQALEIVAKWISPIIMLSGIVVGVIFMVQIGGVDGFIARSAHIEGLSFGSGLTFIIGSWIVGAVMGVDMFRFNKNTRAVFLCAAVCFLVTNPMLNILGYLGQVHISEPNYMAWMLGVNIIVAILGVFVWTSSIWTTNNAELYCNALYNGPALEVFNINVSRVKLVIICGVVGTIIAALGFYQLFFADFIGLLGAIAPPIISPILADFFIIRPNKAKKYSQEVLNTQPPVRWAGVISVLVGGVSGYIFQFVSPLPGDMPSGLTALLLGMLVYVISYYVVPDHKADNELVATLPV